MSRIPLLAVAALAAACAKPAPAPPAPREAPVPRVVSPAATATPVAPPEAAAPPEAPKPGGGVVGAMPPPVEVPVVAVPAQPAPPLAVPAPVTAVPAPITAVPAPITAVPAHVVPVPEPTPPIAVPAPAPVPKKPAPKLSELSVPLIAQKALNQLGRWHGSDSATEVDFGLGGFRWALWELIESGQPELIDSVRERSDALRLANTVNKLLKGALGGDLFDPANPGVVNKKPLAKLLELAWLPPETGAPLWKRYRKPVVEYARVYVALKKHVGKRRTVHEYRRAHKRLANPDLHYNEKMLDWYVQFTKKYDLSRRSGLGPRWDTRIMAGFWVRRMADGTDRMLWKFTQKLLAAYEPELNL